MHQENGEKDPRQPEEIAMMPKRGWGSNGKINEDHEGEDLHCGFGACRPTFLQKFSGVWTFTVVLGLSSLGSDFMQFYLKAQVPMLRRQFQIDPERGTWLVYSSDIACIFGALFLSILARRIHIPRFLAITSAVCGIAGLLCIAPYIATQGDLVPVQKVAENETYSIEKFQMMGPSCLANPKAMQAMRQLMLEEASKMGRGQPPNAGTTTTANPIGEKSGQQSNDSVAPPVTDIPTPSNQTEETVPTVTTVTIPNFKKIATHPNFKAFVQMSKPMGIDLEALAAMDLKEQMQYMSELPPNVKAMLPNMKLMLGPNADSYFITVPVGNAASHKSKRSARKGRINLETDMGYNGQLAQMMKSMPPIKPEILVKLFKKLCPFNTGPFLTDSNSGILSLINVAMILQGIARAPRMAYGVTFLADSTKDVTTALHLGVLYMLAFFGPLLSLLLTFFVNTKYITLEDVGFMTMFNPRWLPAWWIGFIILALYALVFALPLFFFPRKLKSSSKYTATELKNNSCFSVDGYFKELLATLFRLVTNPVFLCLTVGSVLSSFIWTGLPNVLVAYVTHQFSLQPLVPGLYLVLFFTLICPIGVVIGGIISTKCKLSALGNLKIAVGLAFILVIIQACHLGMGCDQPVLDKGLRVVPNISTSDNCSATCPCSDMGYNPSCGSDGLTYYSPCHAGCGEGYDGKYHDCKCIEDSERTVTPGICQNCSLFYPFCFVLCLGGIVVGMMFAPLLIATYRSVKIKDIPMAIGLQAVLFCAVVAMPSPAVYQGLQDKQCMYRRPECGIGDTCAIYDLESFRLQIFGLSFALQVVAALFILVGFLLGRKTSVYHEEAFTKDQVKS